MGRFDLRGAFSAQMGQFGLKGNFWVGWDSLSEVCIFHTQMRWLGMGGAFLAQNIFSKKYYKCLGHIS